MASSLQDSIYLILAIGVWAANVIELQHRLDVSNAPPSPTDPLRFVDRERYPLYEASTDALFVKKNGKTEFELTDATVYPAWDGAERDSHGHFEYMVEETKKFSVVSETDGFRKTGEKDGIIYELHDQMTVEAGGAGFFRLRGEIDIDAKTFVALVADPASLFGMDGTIRVMDFSRMPAANKKGPDSVTGFQDRLNAETGKASRRLWLAYFRQAPGGILPDLDGLDICGWEEDPATGIIWQAAIGAPSLLPKYENKFGAWLSEWYAPAFRSEDKYWGYKLEPIDGGKRTRVTLICQHDLNNWLVPHFISNQMVGGVLADYVRTAEKNGKKHIADGTAGPILARTGF